MKVIFAGAGPGDPGLLTVKTKELLESCRFCIYAGSLISPEVIGLIPADAEKHDSARLDLDEIVALIERARERNVDVLRLHTGDPSIYGAINEQMARLDELGIQYAVVPGVSAFQAGAAALRTELTAPGVSQTIILTRVAGRTPVPPEQELAQLAQTRATLCIFLSMQKTGEIVEALLPHYGADCPAAVVYHASWPDEKIIRCKLSNLAQQVQAADVTRTAMILVGHSLGQCGTESLLYDRTFSHEYRSGKKP